MVAIVGTFTNVATDREQSPDKTDFQTRVNLTVIIPGLEMDWPIIDLIGKRVRLVIEDEPEPAQPAEPPADSWRDRPPLF